QLRLEVAERQDLLGRAVRLQLVSIDDRPEVADPLMGRGGKSLPVLALLQLAVARHHDDASTPAEEPLRPRHSTALREAHAERAGVRLDPRHAHVAMAVEPAEPAQTEQTL